jgi:outer membrane protein OmpA-like peptidoglycan-associated protein
MRAMLSRLTPHLLALGVAVLGLSTTACKKPEYPACKKDKHCNVDLDEKCVDGQCQNCKIDTDCNGKGPNGANWKCAEFRCQDPALVAAGGTPGADIGKPCTQTLDCTGGTVCVAGSCAACNDSLQCSPGTCDMGTGRCLSPGESPAGTACQTDDECPQHGRDLRQRAAACSPACPRAAAPTPARRSRPCTSASTTPNLEAADQEKLKALSECMKTNATRAVILEAHADSRGTEEYNIMLTDKRGNNVKEFLQQLGVDPTRMNVVSKGDLEASGSDDASMQKDRRVQFVWQ